ncbi:WD40 repeat-like protein [Hyphopichia burtonii NRRL Y-1933]|uniref:WD40 repeat-like protein n=1 Tax=Hyphopichia burtonii NRRL Y-1933 TaxID=984485 RepID=A0A1E4RFY5_9ASCO|nr:WD40 repeat-like protein [Hyphopichia burtonii NRRL Y-1933]ODV66158.1 WD40 repeat-like protein [Hyphopichia burtonii NRRL Y-1933]
MSKIRKGISYVLGDDNTSENHILPINAIQFSRHFQKLYTGGRDGTVKEWNPENGILNPVPQRLDSDIQSEDQFEFNDNYVYSNDPNTGEIDQDIDEKVLKLETSISSNPLPYDAPYLKYESQQTNNYNIHFDWINDLRLVNNDQQLVSCSSDLSLKLIDLTSSPSSLENSMTSLNSDQNNGVIHRFPNVHTDYVKKLSYIEQDNQIVSGGLDGRIVIWDLNLLKPIDEFQNVASNTSLPSSVYSLSNNNANLIGTGGPNNTINLYDKRASQSSNSHLIRKLIGHQDNVRCLLMNDNFILSGSSDTTLKLWDLRNFKVYKNFEVHDSAVWSLASTEDFKVFYSGDKSGNILKTDLSYLSTNVNNDLFSNNDFFNLTDTSAVDEKLGISTLIAKNDYPILSLCIESQYQDKVKETSLFALTYSSLNRYHVPNTDQLSRYQYLRSYLDYSINHHDNDELVATGLIDGTTAAVSDTNDLNSDFYDIVSHLSMDTNNFDIQSSLSGGAGGATVFSHGEVDKDLESSANDHNEYNSMFLNINGGGPSMEFVNTLKKELSQKANQNPRIDETPIEILLNPIPTQQVEIIPFNKTPIDQFELTPKSIISKKMFNNKRWMLVLYLNGDIKIWDIFICKEIKTFNTSINNKPMSKDLLEKKLKEMEIIFQEYQTTDTLNNWCEVEIKSGKLFVTLKETSFNNLEIYYDELISQYPFLDFNHPDNIANKKNQKVKVTPDDRFYASRILLNSLLHLYALYEWEFDKHLREELRNSRPKSKGLQLGGFNNGNDQAGSESNSIASNNDESSGVSLKRIRMFSRKSSKNNISLQQQQQQQQLQQQQTQSQTASPAISAISSDMPASFNLDMSEILQPDQTPHQKTTYQEILGRANDDSILKLLQFNKRRYMEKYGASDKKVVDSLFKIYSNDPSLNDSYKDEEFEPYKPLIPQDLLPSNLLIIIFENSSELGNYRDVCSFHYEDLTKLNYNSPNPSTKTLIHDLRNHLPKWIGQPILYDLFPSKECPKIAFQLYEIDYAHLPPNKKIGGKTQRKIKKLPVLESSIKLTSHNMLRVSKILTYLTEKFDTRTSEMKDHKNPTEWLVLECKGEELPNSMTLQTIKTKIWKSSSDIELKFRRKFD